MLVLGSGLFLGWTLGANNAANCFGTAVSARIISFKRACLLCGAAVILGAVLQGQAGIRTLSSLSEQTLTTLVITSMSAGITVLVMTIMSLPASASQAIVGAITGIGLAMGSVNWTVLQKVVICWTATPLVAMLIACLLYQLLGLFLMRIPMGILTRDKFLWSALILVGVYGSYALGANNVANATGIFSNRLSGVSDSALAFWGGVAIALGALTYSRKVMRTVGHGIVPMDAFTALVAVGAMSVTVHIFAKIGVPVSTSEGIVGAIAGIGLTRGVRAIHGSMLRNIAIGWLLTPLVAIILATSGFAIWRGTV